MKAEIGIDESGAPFITLEPSSHTECTLIEYFKKRLGCFVGPDGMYRVGCPSGSPSTPPASAPEIDARDELLRAIRAEIGKAGIPGTSVERYGYESAVNALVDATRRNPWTGEPHR
jgi:hypothetical protein